MLKGNVQNQGSRTEIIRFESAPRVLNPPIAMKQDKQRITTEWVPDTLGCTCWCGTTVKGISVEDVRNGQTFRCGREGCK